MIELLKGSFVGIAFNFTESTIKGSHKIAPHQYINSDVTDFEVMGKGIKTVSVLIYAHGIGAKYFSSVGALETAFENNVEGAFVHPTKGTQNVVIQTYERIEKVTALGKADFRVTYYIDESKGGSSFGGSAGNFFTSSGTTSGSISNKSNQINKFVSIITGLNVTYGASNTWNSVRENIQSSIIAFGNAAKIFIKTEDDYNRLTVELNNWDRFYLIKIADLDSNLLSFTNLLDEILPVALDTYDFFADMFEYGDDRVNINPTTRQLKSELINEISFRDYTQTTALMKVTDAMTRIDFPTQDDLNLKLQIVLNQFEKVQSFDSTDSDLYNDLQKQKVDLIEFVTGIKQTTPRIKTVNVVNESLSTLVYRFYGNNDNYETIRDLNGLIEPSVINGEVKVIGNE